jgi:hypothetical protein
VDTQGIWLGSEWQAANSKHAREAATSDPVGVFLNMLPIIALSDLLMDPTVPS